jgi:hypothetical protein
VDERLVKPVDSPVGFSRCPQVDQNEPQKQLYELKNKGPNHQPFIHKNCGLFYLA